MVQLGTDLRLLIIMSVIALVWVATFSRLKFLWKTANRLWKLSCRQLWKIRCQLFLHKEITVALIHRSQVNSRFYTKDELRQTFCSSSGYVSNTKTGIRRIMLPDELPFVVRRSRRISKESSSRRIMRLVPVFILETHNQTNYKCLPKFVQTDNASLV